MTTTTHETSADGAATTPAASGIDPMMNPMRPAYFLNCAENEHPAETVLRKLAAWLGVGGYNAPRVDVEVFHRKIVDGINSTCEARATRAAPTADEWTEAQLICDLPAVDEAIRNLLEDNTGDNATCLVREVLRASTSAAPSEQARNVTVQEDEWLRKAALRSGTVAAPGRLAAPSDEPSQWLLFEHADGSYAVAPTTEAAGVFTRANPAWVRVGPVAVYGAAPSTVDHVADASKMIQAPSGDSAGLPHFPARFLRAIKEMAAPEKCWEYDDGDPMSDDAALAVAWIEQHAALSAASSSAPAGEPRPTDDALWDQTLTERDNYHEWADKLADAIASHFGIDIGEHTAGTEANNPWANALEHIASALPAGGSAPAAQALLAAKPLRMLTGREAADIWELNLPRDSEAIAIQRKFCEVNGQELAVSQPSAPMEAVQQESQEDRHLVSVSSIDVERMLATCVPGGNSCDPQAVADSIRTYCNAWTPAVAPSVEPVAWLPKIARAHLAAGGKTATASGVRCHETDWPVFATPPLTPAQAPSVLTEVGIDAVPISDAEQAALYEFTRTTPHHNVVRTLYRLAYAQVNAAAPAQGARMLLTDAQIEKVAEDWDGCFCDAPFGEIEVGPALRRQLRTIERAAIDSAQGRVGGGGHG